MNAFKRLLGLLAAGFFISSQPPVRLSLSRLRHIPITSGRRSPTTPFQATALSAT